MIIATEAHQASTSRARRPAAVVVIAAAAAVPTALLVGSQPGLMLLAGAVAVALGMCALANPVFATIALLVTMFLRFPIKSVAGLPVELFLLVFVLVVGATALWMDRTPDRLRGTGAIEWAMTLFVTWNVFSMLTSHEYAAINALTAEPMSASRFIVVSTVIPFAMYVVGRYTFDRDSVVRILLWMILTLAAYSAAVSIMPFVGLSDLVWPRYIVDIANPSWHGRAVGIFNQPVVNGMVLALGLAIGMLLMSRRDEPRWRRCAALLVAAACGAGIYFTHTRASWLSAVAVLIIGALLARGFRHGFLVVLYLLFVMVLLNWSTLTSSDRSSGGVASEGEVESRLNDIQTALWAFTREPIEGWGIGRFPAVNTYHHQQWSRDVLWSNGYGEAMHQNELAILAELGLIGLAAWLAVLVLLARRLWKAYTTLPDGELCGKPLAVISIMALTILVSTGLTVDLRYFDFSIAVIFLLVGITIGWLDRLRYGEHGLELVRRKVLQ